MYRSPEFLFITSIVISSFVLSIFCFFIFRILKLYNKKQIEYRNGLDVLRLEKEATELITRIETQEQTFQLIGREIHDNINQVLTLAKLTLASSVNVVNDETQLVFNQASTLIVEAISGLTAISISLNSELIMEIGLIEILKRESSRLKKIGNEIDLNIDENIEELNPTAQLLIFRISQETIRNAITHGKAKNIYLTIRKENQTVYLKIADNGAGFNVADIKEKKLSQGLKNIKNRIEMSKGDFSIYSSSNTGTIIEISLPIV